MRAPGGLHALLLQMAADPDSAAGFAVGNVVAGGAGLGALPRVLR
jgi:hypothetical protein